jgi:hypothetical protein
VTEISKASFITLPTFFKVYFNYPRSEARRITAIGKDFCSLFFVSMIFKQSAALSEGEGLG